MLAALIAGVVSFLSPCVLPLVPPYLVYLAGSSLERLADDDPKTGSMRDTLRAALLFVGGFSTVFVALGASASVIGGVVRAWSAELSIVAGVAIIVMGLHFLGVFRIGWLLAREAHGDGEARRALGRLCDGARLCVRLDALHRADPGGDPRGRRVRADGGERARACSRSIRSGLAFRFFWPPPRSSRLRHFLARFRRHLVHMERVMGGLLVLTGVAFLTGSVSQASFWLLETFPVLGKIG